MSSIAGNTSTTATLAPGATATHTIDATGDADWFAVTLGAGLSYSFTVQSNGGTGIGLPGPDLKFFDPLGNELDSVTNYSATTATISYRINTAGTYFMGVSDYNGGLTGRYTVSWVATDNVRNDVLTNRTIAANGTATSKLDVAGDSDWFKLNMTAGLSYGFEVQGAVSADLLVGSDMQLRDGAGNQLDSSTTYSGTFNQINWNATVTGGYIISVNDGNSDVGDYSVRFVATDNIQNNVTTTHSLVRNGLVTSKLDVGGDADWFKLAMTSGLSYGFELRGASTDLLVGSDLQLRDAAGNVLETSTTFSGTANDLYFNPTANGTYFLSVNDANSDVGGYSVRFVATDTIQNNITTTSALARNSVVSSRLDVDGDSDWFRITMTAGESYGFQVLSATADPLQWGDLQLRDAQGNVISSMTSFSASSNALGFTAITTGTYYISVNDAQSDAGNYTLRNIGLDTVRANVNTTSTLADGTRIVGRIDMLDDSDWHRMEAQQGQTYTFTLSGDGTVNDLATTFLILRDAAGNVVSQSIGATASLTYTATTTGPLFLDVRGNDSSDTGGYALSVVSNAPTLRGTAGADRLQGGAGATVMNGYAGDDWMDGGTGNDRLFGSIGNDRLFGNANDDRLYGGDGGDVLFGGSGADQLEGELGNDTLWGGADSDRFVFRAGVGSDLIEDFQDGADRIQIIGGPTSISGLVLQTVGTDVRITFGTVTILVADITKAELTSADFIFG